MPESIEQKIRKEVKFFRSNLSGDLTFVTDENIFKEFINYYHKDIERLAPFCDKSDFLKKLRFLNIIDLECNPAASVMEGSNIFINIAMDMFSKKYLSGYRLARQVDLEQHLNYIENFPVSANIYTGLVLKSVGEGNWDQGENLLKQLKRRGIRESDFPIWLDLRGLELSNSFKIILTDEARYKKKADPFYDIYDGHFFSKTDDAFGLPILNPKDKNKSRKIYNWSYSLSAAYMDTSFNLILAFSRLYDFKIDSYVLLAKNSSS